MTSDSEVNCYSMYGLLISAFTYFIFGTFCSTFSGIYGLNVIIYTPILVLWLGMVLWWLLQDFRPFDIVIGPHLSATRVPLVPCPWSKRRTEDFGTSQNQGPIVVSPTNRGEPIAANLFIFLRCASEDAPFSAYKACFLAEEKRMEHPSPSHYYSHIHLSFS